MRRPHWLVSPLLVSSLALAQPAPSDPTERFEALERRVHELEARLAAQDAGAVPPPADAGVPEPSGVVVRAGSNASLTVSGLIETYYQWNFNQPSNFITNYPGFDNRHNTFTLQNALVDLLGKLGPVTAHLALQWGATAETYYASEPVWRATAGTGASGKDVWKFLQQANVGAVAPVGRGLTVEGGLFTSPIGPESFLVKDEWNWSRSNLFFGLPFYHTGVRLSYPLAEGLVASLAGYNGWNSVVDNNVELSIAAQLLYIAPERLEASVLYFTGVERPQGAPEGRAWRHLFDAYVLYTPASWWAVSLHVDGGFEPNAFGTSGWFAAAGYARFQLAPRLFFAPRVDFFREWVAQSSAGSAAPIFWGGAGWVASATATLEYRALDNLSVRLEYRHDHSDAPVYFAGAVATDSSGAAVTNARAQDTLTAGLTAWF